MIQQRIVRQILAFALSAGLVAGAASCGWRATGADEPAGAEPTTTVAPPAVANPDEVVCDANGACLTPVPATVSR